MRRLLIERAYIYAKLYNPGGSIILRGADSVDPDRPLGYSSQIGNTFHLDLIELDRQFAEAVAEGDLTHKQVRAIQTWADGMNSRDAADFLHAKRSVSIQKMRQRAVKKLQERLDGNPEADEPRGTSDRTTSS